MNNHVDAIRGYGEGLRELALFAGAGGGILGGKLLGWRTVCAVEIEPYPRQVLAQRQTEGMLEPFPIWDDICTFDGRRWRGIVDVVSGGFPCQDISAIGKASGITGERSGLWKHMARVIQDVQPTFAFIENSPCLRIRGLDVVLQDLAEIGFDAEWCCLSAKDSGAPHVRERMWILAYPAKTRLFSEYREQNTLESEVDFSAAEKEASKANTRPARWKLEDLQDVVASVAGVYDGVAHRLDRSAASGNGQVPIVAARAFVILARRLGLRF